ncbi:MAG: neutral/alkaline non-lysosomal ceramidase N-terminal domain-containing protein [Bacteroidetes bacterium]|nr:neutral/alkaline non-lysosomal ceramidase N-terminal domain-containing protein [Bacteroidota bacterium]
MFEIGTGIGDITAFKKGIGMMGYGMHFNTVEEIETHLSARAFVIKDASSSKKIVFVNAEICFITISIKSGVIKKLQGNYPQFGYTHDNVILTAQHTHSAPGGYSHYAFYNLSIPGFVPEVYEAIVNGIVEAIVKAENTIQPANLYMNTGTFEPELEVAFNRSIKAYNANPEVQKIDADKTHLAVDREMTLIRIDGLNGEKIGMINWFSVHTTSISNDNNKICSDNKGYASAYFEKDIRSNNEQKNFIAAFAQGATGDISPNFIWDKKKNWMRGKFEDDFESAKFNGKLQYTKAKEIYDAALKNQVLKNEIDYVNMSFDFSNIVPDTEFTNGQKVQTGSACHGVAFFVGTAEARGMNDALAAIARFFSRTVKIYELIKAKFLSEEKGNKIRNKYKIQGKKDILFETGEGKVLGTSNITNLIIPSWVDKGIKTFKTQYHNGALKAPWIPQILPLQLIIIGELAIASFPGEITTIAGLRLKNTIQGILEKKGIKKVIISPYANAFCGYVTTYEEYQCQLYEGGHTVFGEWTLAAFQTKFKELALQLLEKPEERKINRSIVPIEFTEEELSKRSYSEV